MSDRCNGGGGCGTFLIIILLILILEQLGGCEKVKKALREDQPQQPPAKAAQP